MGIVCASLMIGRSVSKELATKVAIQYIKNDRCNVAPSEYALLTRGNSIDTTYTHIISPMGRAPLYLVQLQDGWVLVASEYVTTPVLASSSAGLFPDSIDMPDAQKWLLSYYEDAVRYTRDSILSIDSDTRQSWALASGEKVSVTAKKVSSIPSDYEIDSIRLLRWNQCGNNGGSNINKSYNKFCPTWSASCWGHTYVGCVAVAMGLVMRYYKWPYSAFIPNTIDSLGNISQTTHLVTYDWNDMPRAIVDTTNMAKVNEIAGFLRDCGYSCKIKYQADGSPASLENAKYALEHNFHYNNLTCQTRNGYIGNWVKKLKTEIASNRPVIYAGYNSRGVTGHAFVLYGYTNQDQFVIHWGWGDDIANNTVYTLNNLIPIGYNPIQYNYNYCQQAIWGITPEYPECGTYNVLQQSYLNNEHFEIYHKGTIVVPWFPIQSHQSGAIIAGEKVRIAQGFKVNRGAHVIFDVRNMPCDESRESPSLNPYEAPDIRHAPRKIAQNEESSATKFFHNGQLLILRDGKTYSVTGQKIAQ